MNMQHQGPVWPGPGPQPPTWPAPPPVPKPERGPRPDDVKLSVQLWIFVIITSAISRLAQAFSTRGSDESREQYTMLKESDSSFAKSSVEQFKTFEQYDTTMFVMAIATVVIGVVVASVLVYFLWRGQSWARLVLQFVAAFVLVQGVFAFTTGNATIAVPAILAAVAVVGAMITANSRESMEYFKPGSTAAGR
ncbi:hypothetical protein SAMN04489765_4147 [Tsukamurella pulmonis]|uniref:Uncharacterized protein n=1 Tax=Tsukamurella pulmonis TaxID=47312 RepID=A0A1H1HFN9_9ACTN|nr:hypothetical protein [Tsukamurella pulmonis]SDR24281.1 hypothetical protein SAMN04489765_4147 [Tsukamurella pulmonis]SUP14821.1 Uncharacterised protein [Tsukamurella pulmonis]